MDADKENQGTVSKKKKTSQSLTQSKLNAGPQRQKKMPVRLSKQLKSCEFIDSDEDDSTDHNEDDEDDD